MASGRYPGPTPRVVLSHRLGDKLVFPTWSARQCSGGPSRTLRGRCRRPSVTRGVLTGVPGRDGGDAACRGLRRTRSQAGWRPPTWTAIRNGSAGGPEMAASLVWRAATRTRGLPPRRSLTTPSATGRRTECGGRKVEWGCTRDAGTVRHATCGRALRVPLRNSQLGVQ